MRINGFHQIAAFYSKVFSQEHDFKPQHISLYVFLLNQNNRNNWVEWFKVPIDLGMTGSCIGSKKTYYACLEDLQTWGLLNYEKGENMWKAPKVRLVVLKSTSTYTSTVPQSEPLPEPLPTPDQHLNLHPYINLQPTTSNLQHITNTIEERKLKFASTLEPFLPKYGKEFLNEFYKYWTEMNKSQTKFRQESERFWDLPKRLGTWEKNNSKFKQAGLSNQSQKTSPKEAGLEALRKLYEEERNGNSQI